MALDMRAYGGDGMKGECSGALLVTPLFHRLGANIVAVADGIDKALEYRRHPPAHWPKFTPADPAELERDQFRNDLRRIIGETFLAHG